MSCTFTSFSVMVVMRAFPCMSMGGRTRCMGSSVPMSVVSGCAGWCSGPKIFWFSGEPCRGSCTSKV